MTKLEDHKALVASLSAGQRRALVTRRNAPAAIRLAAHLGSIAGLGTYTIAGLPGWPLTMAAQGVLIAFLFTLLHEVIHNTAFRTDALNTWTAHLCGFLILLPPRYFRYFHLAHHRFTHDPENDPELATPKPGTWTGYIVMLSGLPDLAGRIGALLRNASVQPVDAFIPSRGRIPVQREARLYICGYGMVIAFCLAAGSETLLWVWLLPSLIGQPFLRAYLLAEHARCPHVSNMLANTRTTFTNRLVRLIAWNMPYHSEHHAYPAVPFHNLPDWHALARDHLATTANGYRDFHAGYIGGVLNQHQPRS